MDGKAQLIEENEDVKLPDYVIKDNFEERLSENAMWTFKKKYLLRNSKGEITETPKQAIYRVARTMAEIERGYGLSDEDIDKWTEKFYRIISNKEFSPGGRVWTNAGTKITGLFNCYVLPVPDSIEGIYESVRDAALIQKHGGGTGYNFFEIRPRGSYVIKSKGIASGVVSFIRQFDRQTEVINSGNRRGANMGILDVNHPDIIDFIYAKAEKKEITNFNVSIGATEKFMQAVENKGYYDLEWENQKFKEETLKNCIKNIEGGLAGAEVGQKPKPSSISIADNGIDVIDTYKNRVVGRINDGIVQLKADVVMQTICELAWRTGDPGMIFLDEINKHNPLPKVGKIKATNPCVAGDTLIATNNGLIQAKILAENKEELDVVVDSRLAQEKTLKSSKVFVTGIKPIFKLKTKEGYEIRLTSDHKVLTDNGWIEAKELEQGNKIYIQNRKGCFGLTGTIEQGRVLGWLVGDGTFNPSKGAVLSFFAQDIELAPEFSEYVSEMIGKRISAVQIKRRNEMRISSVKLQRIAEAFGLTKKTKISVPIQVFAASEKFQQGFLQGVFSSDGHFSGTKEKGYSVRLTSISTKFLKDVQRMLLNLGIASKLYINRHPEREVLLPDGKGGKKIYICHSDHDLVISKDNLLKFFNEIGFLSPAKQSKLLKACQSYSKGPYQEKFTVTFKEFIPDGIETVYDLNEPISHSFIANGLIVHNCGEQPLHPYDACNLGSINLDCFVIQRNGKAEVDEEKLREVTKVIIRFMDNVNDANKGPIPIVEQTVLKHRRIGLGVMGFADMLIQLGIAYGSEEALQVAEVVMGIINEESKTTSAELAREKGVFPAFNFSKYNTGNVLDRVRNSERTTIAPTGTISMIFDTSSGIEPWFGMIYKKNVRGGESLYYVNKYLEKALKEKGIHSKELLEKIYQNRGCLTDIEEIPENIRKVFKTTFDTSAEQHVKIQAAFQKHVDNAVSKTINMPEEATIEDVRNAYIQAWKMHLKGITVYRDKCLDVQVLETGSKKKEKPKEIQNGESRERKEIIDGKTVKVKTPIGTAFVTLNYDEIGPRETFINVGKSGSDISADSEAMGRLLSLCFRYNIPINEITDQLKGIKSNPIVTEKGWIYSLADGIAKAIEIIDTGRGLGEKQTTLPTEIKKTKEESIKQIKEKQEEKIGKLTGNMCPDCGNLLEMIESCETCRACGYSRC